MGRFPRCWPPTAGSKGRRLRIGAGLGLAAQIVAAGVGFALSLILAFRSGMVMPPAYALGYLSGAAILSWILPGVKRI